MSTSPEPPREESPERIPVGAELQILATEHWGLLATRSMIWNEMFAKISSVMYVLARLETVRILSGGMVQYPAW